MKSILILLFSIPLLAAEPVPQTVRVSGGFMFRDNVTHDFGGTLHLVRKEAARTHHQGVVQIEAITHDNKAAEKRINLIGLTKKGKSHVEFALFQNDYIYEFHFNLPTLVPSAGIPVVGIVKKYEQYYCGPLFTEMCQGLVETGPADLTVSY